ncbi:MAG: nitronate monooxygenase [Nocardiaceae bacterium]|nr:nitronate monooxygenase [Nocardiaceae bacterium]
MGLIERIGIEHPVVQAGMGGGIATGTLAGAVSAAGGLGTVGILPPKQFEAELEVAHEQSAGRPIAANLLVPFTTRAHVDAIARSKARVVTLHGGFESRLVHRLQEDRVCVLATVGTVDEARQALAGGANGLVVQGIEAGGHLVGVEPALEALQRIHDATGSNYLLVAGGIANADDTRRALDAGAAAVVAGTRFLLTHECRAHETYKQRVITADRTFETMLFSMGWPMRHRVIPNAATDRWCRDDPRGPGAIRRLASWTGGMRHLPMAIADRFAVTQRPAIPFFGPASPLVGMPERLVDATALYAGETALRIGSVVPAAVAVRELAGVP